MNAPSETSSLRLAHLSPRERQVLALIGAGYTLAQIAAILGVSAGTVDIYCNRVMVKLEVYDLAGLARLQL
jgi:DNA-binding CsgD family transcriptional regulator